MSPARNGAAPLPRADRRELAAMIARRGGLMPAAVACGVAIETLRRARDGKAVMRPVLTREELERLLPRLPELEPLGDVPPDSRAAGEYYRAILSGHDCVALLRLCKTLHAKQNSQTASRRGVNSTELRSWRMAEEMLYGEFGFALGLPPAQVRDYLREKLGG